MTSFLSCFLLSISSLAEAVREMVTFLGLQACDGSDVVPQGASKHILYLSGRFMDADNVGTNVIARYEGIGRDALSLLSLFPFPDLLSFFLSSFSSSSSSSSLLLLLLLLLLLF
jgi:hypothetical protein